MAKFSPIPAGGLKLKAGAYEIVDPCYLDGEWYDDLCNELDERSVVMELPDGETFLIWGTCYGDGGYDVRDLGGVKLGTAGVDAGILCIHPLDVKEGGNGLDVLIHLATDGVATVEHSDLLIDGKNVCCTCEKCFPEDKDEEDWDEEEDDEDEELEDEEEDEE